MADKKITQLTENTDPQLTDIITMVDDPAGSPLNQKVTHENVRALYDANTAHKTRHQNGGGDEISVAGLSGELADAQPPKAHNLGGAEHNADTLANLNAKISDGTVADLTSGVLASRPVAGTSGRFYWATDNDILYYDNGSSWDTINAEAEAHNLGGTEHNADTLANLNAKITDATLIDTTDSRLSDARTPTSHAATHTNGTDDIQDATAVQKGLMTSAYASKLDGIEAGATADQTAGEIKTAYESNVDTNAFTDADESKLDGIEAGADVTDTANVDAAGAVMDTDLIATSAGVGDAGKPIKLDAAGHVDATMINDADISLDNITEGVTNKFFTSTDKSKLDGIEAGAEVNNISDVNATDLTDGGESTLHTHPAATPAAHAATHTNGTDDIQDATAAQKGLATAAQISKLDGIEASADVTDATNVDAAGATMNTDSSLVGNSYFLDEDNMASDDATKVPSQQSVKAYVDAAVVGLYDNKGAYDAATNTPDLDTTPSGVKNGDAYTVSVAGNFFTEAVEVGDVLIANQDNPTLLSHWSRINKNISFGTSAGTACEGNDSRLSDARTPTSHAASHTDGSDDIQLATASVKGLMSTAYASKLDGIEASADVTDTANVDAAGAVMDTDLIATSAGAGDAGKPIKLDAAGHVDATMINDADINLDNITEGVTNLFFTSSDNSKLDGIEASADVTDAANVDAAGATMNTDSSLVGNSYFLDEDTMVSDDATKVASQQSVKAYADTKIAGPGTVVDNTIVTFDGTTGLVVQDSGVKAESAPTGGSGVAVVEYASAPTTPPAGFVWIQAIDANTKKLAYFDGTNTFSVQLGKE